MLLIGLDIGTSGCKAAVFREDGTLLTSANREYSIEMPIPGWAEQDAEQVWRLAQDALREILATLSQEMACRERVAALSLSVQGEAIIPVDGAGRALRSAILGMDTRTVAQNAWLRERFDAARLYARTGMPVHTVNTLPKLLWLQDHEPQTWASASHFLLYEDFLIQKMTGERVVSRCLASRTQLYDLRADAWAAEILDVLELSPSRLSEVQPAGVVIGRMRADLAADLGFSGSPLVVTGGHDQACGALGVGLTRPGLAMVSTGTAEVVELTLSAAKLDEVLGRGEGGDGGARDSGRASLYQGNVSVYAHTAPDLYLAMTLNHSGGLILRWYRDTFGRGAKREARVGSQDSDLDAYDLLLAEASPEPSPLLLLPHFAGSGTPSFDTASKGALLGLTFATTKADVVKAILEGLTFELRLNLDLLQGAGLAITELRAIGGGARSELWLQLKADITGIPVVVPRVVDAACWGAALLAGHGAGCFPSLHHAAVDTVALDRAFEPQFDRQRRFAQRYQLYQELYPKLRSLLRRI